MKNLFFAFLTLLIAPLASNAQIDCVVDLVFEAYFEYVTVGSVDFPEGATLNWSINGEMMNNGSDVIDLSFGLFLNGPVTVCVSFVSDACPEGVEICETVDLNDIIGGGDGTIDPCTDLEGVSFGACTLVLGIAVVNGSCTYVSGCGWEVNGIDYSPAFYLTIEACNSGCNNPIDCINPDLIDPNAACFALWDPVCGCDAVTYGNECEAINYGGVTSWTEGECSGGGSDCPEILGAMQQTTGPCNWIFEVEGSGEGAEVNWDFGDGTGESAGHIADHHYAEDGDYIVTAAYSDLLCEGVVLYVTIAVEGCSGEVDCIDQDQIDNDMICTQQFEPVCGCNNITYSNECYAYYYGGVTSWVQGECENQGCIYEDGTFYNVGSEVFLSECEYIYCEGPNNWSSVIEIPDCGEEEFCPNNINIIPPKWDFCTWAFEIDTVWMGAGNPPSWMEVGWDFGDGSVLTNEDFWSHHVYDTDGVYEVNVQYWDSNCPNGVELSVVIQVEGCGEVDCINQDQIDNDMLCTEEWDPVCGCDDITYSNHCYAYYYGGVTSWVEGECTNSVSDIDGNPSWSVFPVPTSDLVTFKGLYAGTHFLKIYDNQGRIVVEVSVSNGETISLKELINGWYTMQIVGVESSAKRVVIQR